MATTSTADFLWATWNSEDSRIKSSEEWEKTNINLELCAKLSFKNKDSWNKSKYKNWTLTSLFQKPFKGHTSWTMKIIPQGRSKMPESGEQRN